MKNMPPVIFLAGLIITVMTSCTPRAPAPYQVPSTHPAGTPVSTEDNEMKSSKTLIPQNAAPTESIQLDEDAQAIVARAKQDLAQRLSVSVDDVTFLTVFGQEFSADAFYCRTTKERIAREESPQVISGLSIFLSAAGRRYEYHASDQTVIFCRLLI